MSQESTPQAVESATRECPFCAEKISVNAKKCKHCGETVDVTLRVAEESRRANVGAAGGIVVNTAVTQAVTQQGAALPAVYLPKSRGTYIVLAVLLGSIGIHNFYAGYAGRGIVQLLLGLTMVGAIISWPWAIIEAIVVKRDAHGATFS